MSDGDYTSGRTAIAALATFPLGILAWILGAFLALPNGIGPALLSGTGAAAVVFVVGWLLVVPVLAIRDGVLDGEEESAGEASEDPLETLRERYAAGEIDRHEFERRVEDLLGTEDDERSPEHRRSESVERSLE